MLKKNVGSVDRGIRIVVGLVLLAALFAYPFGAWSWLLLIGVLPLATGLLGTCGLYSVLGIDTCPGHHRSDA